MMPTTPSLPSRLNNPTRLSVMPLPKKGDEGPKRTSKIIAIAISNRPKSMISLNICLILDIITYHKFTSLLMQGSENLISLETTRE